MANKIQAFFREAEEIWEAIPGYVKVFIYSTLSTSIGLYFSGQFNSDSVLAIVLTNLGLYGVPRIMNTEVKKL